MTTFQAQLPDPLAEQVEELARQEKVSLDQLGIDFRRRNCL
jgi:hypothetical protein